MNFKELIGANKFSLVVSLPANNLDLAKAALAGGAQAVKVHMNVWHRASGNTFGSFRENRKFMEELIAIAGQVPVGLVPGGEDAFINREEMLELESMGLQFFSSYAHHLPPFMMESTKLGKMVAIDYTYTQNTLDAVKASAIDVLEASIMPGDQYGKPLNYSDVLRYSDVAAKTGKPVLVPTQKKVLPSEIRTLRDAGCKAVMIGAIVMGNESPGDCEKAAAEFRKAVDSL
ncbi:hypothetical protein [Breznakiella homolactica]|uniref:Uncharacterized protein n=1 Tax=Breznakiella homolactica TaxID=2798577 RepID=A0A7T7XRQ8_9SPIR|nr:hypothetical protein [Breznakiella homolactica]QQO11173.1 hypothetical protein JFL75_09750 [Breznakiella homolactica]